MLLHKPLSPDLVRLECDRLTGSYLGLGSNRVDYGWLQATRAVERDQDVFYFEVKFHSVGVSKKIMIGFANAYHKRRKLGIFPGEIGYCIGSKNLYLGSKRGIKLKHFSRVRDGDVLGCGFNVATQQLIFAKNGKLLPLDLSKLPWKKRAVEFGRSKIARLFRGNIIPTLCFHSADGCATVSFGEPFHFKHLFKLDEARQRMGEESVERVRGSTVSFTKTMLPVVRDYLVQNGLTKSLASFDRSVASHLVDEIDSSQLSSDQGLRSSHSAAAFAERSRIRELILSNDIAAARLQIEESYPAFAARSPPTAEQNASSEAKMEVDDYDEKLVACKAATKNILQALDEILLVLDFLKLLKRSSSSLASTTKASGDGFESLIAISENPSISRLWSQKQTNTNPQQYCLADLSGLVFLDDEEFQQPEVKHLFSNTFRAELAFCVNNKLLQLASVDEKPTVAEALEPLTQVEQACVAFQRKEEARFSSVGSRGSKKILWTALSTTDGHA